MKINEILEELASQATSEFKTYDDNDINQARSQIIAAIEEALPKEKAFVDFEGNGTRDNKRGYNQALTDVISKLKDL